VIDRPRQHTGELDLSQARFDGRDLSLGVANGTLVVLGDAELEILVGFGEIFF
jgi:hypothetical protein